MAAKKFIRTTPEGIAKYPWLGKADTKFAPEGEYKVDLKMDLEDAAAQIEEMEEILEDFYQEKLAELNKPADKKKLTKAQVYHDVEDDNGDLTGEVFFRFKMKATVKTKDGKEFTQKPAGFDAAGKPWDQRKLDKAGKPIGQERAVYGGSALKINYEAVPYYNAKDKACGLTLRLRAFQVISLVTSGGGTASGYGFDADPNAFVPDTGAYAEDDTPPFEPSDQDDF